MRNYLRELRAKKNLTQLEVAKFIGISESTYSLIESRQRQKDLDLSILIKLAKAFDVSVDYIIEEERKLADKTA